MQHSKGVVIASNWQFEPQQQTPKTAYFKDVQKVPCYHAQTNPKENESLPLVLNIWGALENNTACSRLFYNTLRIKPALAVFTYQTVWLQLKPSKINTVVMTAGQLTKSSWQKKATSVNLLLLSSAESQEWKTWVMFVFMSM